MDKGQARKIIRDAFESRFDRKRYIRFLRELLNSFDDEGARVNQGARIPEKFQDHVEKIERVGKYTKEKIEIMLFIVYLKRETAIERARTMQRNFVAWYLSQGEKDAALVAYVSPDQADWRFSLVKMDYNFEKTKTGKVKVKEEFTPARRWSFLVGANEKSHTAQSRLENTLANDEQAPTLEELENAFDIETVTKEFFLKYRELFLRTKEALDKVVKKDPKIKADFEAKGVDTVNFAKKLLGQIVFLYFLQKKGWFGVGRDDDWGSGSKHFLRELFEDKHGSYSNFFNEILEPLFYEALRSGKDREHIDYYYSRFNCKIPFLNGGLFDPIGNYDWVHTDINLPNNLFSNSRKTKEGDIGDGIMDVFDRYNFTVREDEPLEKEVAIDPELLGKAYEKFNAIRPDNFDEFTQALKSGKKGKENKFNKKFGVYYTPREIVHYMCKQSLIQYLGTALENHKEPVFNQPASQLQLFGDKKPKQRLLAVDSDKPVVSMQDIEDLIEVGEMITEHEATALIKEEKIKNGSQKSTEYTALLPDSIRKNARLIDDLLADITVCDPAVGSGAFPVGMMNEIVRARNVLSVFLKEDGRSDYEFKRRCIEHSLYGVDIDPGAVEIAKLRLWLSLVVDEEDIKNIKPLPNLDYRIMQGNSLISEFMGFNFDTEQNGGAENQLLKIKDDTEELIERFQQKKDQFLNESNVSRKTALREEVDNLLIELFESKLKKEKAYFFNRLKNIRNKYAVLPNEQQRNEIIKQEEEKLYKESGFDLEATENQLKKFSSGRQIKPFFLWNLYFSEVFHNKGGFDVVIANPPYVDSETMSASASEFRDRLKQQYLTAKGNWDLFVVFVERGTQLLRPKGHLTFILPNKLISAKYTTTLRKYLAGLAPIEIRDYSHLGVFQEADVYPVTISVQRNNKYKPGVSVVVMQSINAIGCQSIVPGLVFSADIEWGKYFQQETVVALLLKLAELPKLSSRYGPVLGAATVGEAYEIKNILVDSRTLQGKRLVNTGTIDPYCSLWGVRDTTYIKGQYRFPAVPESDLRRISTTRAEQANAAKIIVAGMSKRVEAFLDKGDYIAGKSTTIVLGKYEDLKHLLGILNSTLITFYLNSFYHALKMAGGYINVGTNVLRSLPVPEIDSEQKAAFDEVVNHILSAKCADQFSNTLALEKEIDQLVYKLYGLTKEEIKIVEGETA